jgi:hypothetical protein
MQHSTDEYAIRLAEPGDAELIARQRASMFRDMGAVSPEESDLLRKASEPWLFDLLTNGGYRGWLVEHERTVVAGGGLFVQTLGRFQGVIGWAGGGISRTCTQNRHIGGGDWRAA